MSWHFSQALAAEYSAASCSGGERFAPLNLTPTPQAYCSPDRMTAFSRLSRFGMTFAPLTDAHGEELLTWFLAGFPARTSAQPEKAQDSTESEAASGWKWPASLVKYDRASRSWRTRQCSLIEGLDEFSETWPRWGSMRDGECWELETLAHGTRGAESGSWLPTICANESKGSGRKRYRGSKEYRGVKMSEGLRTSERDPIYLNPLFGEIAMGWPRMWTALDVSATAKCHSAPLKRGAC